MILSFSIIELLRLQTTSRWFFELNKAKIDGLFFSFTLSDTVRIIS